MKQLVVLCHPSGENLSKVIYAEMMSLYEKYKLEFELRDLYKIGFNPVTLADENSNEKVSDDILAEQESIRNADLITFVYPTYGMGMPAMMKGYLEKVFVEDFAYAIVGNKLKKLLKGKKVAIINLLEQDYYLFPEAIHEHDLRLQQQLFELFGMDVILQYFVDGIDITQESHALKTKVEDMKVMIKKTLFINRNSRLSIPTAFF